jgi:broad specificity phosphatase PhoE
MEIVIMRHGQPDVPNLPYKISSRKFAECLNLYKQCGIADNDKIATSLAEKFRNYNTIVTSDLKRSIDSAQLLSPLSTPIIDPLFREIDDSFIPIPFLKLKAMTWSKLFILLWVAGTLEFKKAFREGKLRAKLCAEKLIFLAEQHERVLFVGHGFINTYIAKELNRLDWQGPKFPSKQYWEYSIYKKQTYQ